MTGMVDHYHTKIIYKGYKESEFLKNLEIAEDYFDASKSEGYIEENDTYSHNSLDIKDIDNFADYSDIKKILEKQHVKQKQKSNQEIGKK